TTFRITLIQGLNRQIRRMCEHFGYEVIKLERIRIMNINLKGLPVGDWRDLTESEMKTIYAMIAKSSGEDKTKKSSHKHNQVRKSSSTSGTKKSTSKGKGTSFGKKTIRRGR
ncbi:MAG: 23S rRNA pseudouridine(2604) synthase RluF, partial [Bacteroidota bacterium]